MRKMIALCFLAAVALTANSFAASIGGGGNRPAPSKSSGSSNSGAKHTGEHVSPKSPGKSGSR